jgi:hypothetical protein
VPISPAPNRRFIRRLLAAAGTFSAAAAAATAGAPAAAANVSLTLPGYGDRVTIFEASFTCVRNQSYDEFGALQITTAGTGLMWVHLSPADTTCLTFPRHNSEETITVTNRGHTALGVDSDGYAQPIIVRARVGAGD